jgi:hypothetical protein
MTTTTGTTTTTHEQIAVALEELAEFVRARPDLPMPRVSSIELTVFAKHDDFAEVDRIAGLLGVQASDKVHGGARTARVQLPGGGAYEVICHTSDTMRQHHALMSYSGTVAP